MLMFQLSSECSKAANVFEILTWHFFITFTLLLNIKNVLKFIIIKMFYLTMMIINMTTIKLLELQ